MLALVFQRFHCLMWKFNILPHFRSKSPKYIGVNGFEFYVPLILFLLAFLRLSAPSDGKDGQRLERSAYRMRSCHEAVPVVLGRIQCLREEVHHSRHWWHPHLCNSRVGQCPPRASRWINGPKCFSSYPEVRMLDIDCLGIITNKCERLSTTSVDWRDSALPGSKLQGKIAYQLVQKKAPELIVLYPRI